MPQTLSIVLRNRTNGPPGLNIACQQFQDLAKGQVWIAHARVGIAISSHHDQFEMSYLSALGECLDQHRFPPARTAGDKNDLALSGQRNIERFV